MTQFFRTIHSGATGLKHYNNPIWINWSKFLFFTIFYREHPICSKYFTRDIEFTLYGHF